MPTHKKRRIPARKRRFDRLGPLLLAILVSASTARGVLAQRADPSVVLQPVAASAEATTGGSSWIVRFDTSVLERNPPRFRVQFPDGDEKTLERTSWSREGGVLGWDGRVVGARSEFSTATLSIMDGLVVGIIDTESARYRFAPRAEGQMVIRSTGSEFQCAGAVLPPRDLLDARPAQSDGLVDVTLAAGRPVVSVLILFTPQGSSAIGGALAQQANAAVRYLNRVLDNSGARGSARLAGVEIIDTLDGENGLDNYLSRLRRDAEAARLREVYRADVVHLFTGMAEAGRDCGIAYLLQRGDSSRSMAPFAFGTTSIRCDPEATFAHEFGHNVGLNHNPEDAGSPFPFKTYAYAHRNGSVKTTMSYGGQREIPYFSSPLLNVDGFVPGVANSRDNVRVLYDSMVIASGYVGQQDNVGVEAPSGLEGMLVAPDTALLSWTDNSSDETSFRVESRPEGEGWSTAANVAADATQAEVPNLPPGTSIQFRVRAVRSGQLSSPSNVIALETASLAEPPRTLTAMPISASQIELSWEASEVQSIEPVRLMFLSRSPTQGEVVTGLIDGYTGDAGSLLIEGLTAQTPYSFTGVVENPEGSAAAEGSSSGTYGNTASATTMGAGGACDASDEATLCLQNGRFEVRSQWRTEQGTAVNSGPGTGLPIAGSEESGRFWFFDSSNVELLVKVLDARVINGSFWHYYGALSDVEYWITVRDVETEETRTYYNPQGEQCGLGDIAAFPLPPANASPPTQGTVVQTSESFGREAVRSFAANLVGATSAFEGSACTPDEQTVCLGEGRFSVRVDWQVDGPVPEAGVGVPLPDLATSDTGFFWFFDESNVELAVKILDARVINQRFWFYWGALSDVAYQIRIYDHDTAEEMVVENAKGNLCGGSDIETLGG